MRKIRELDRTDRAILLQLTADGRLSNQELAQRVGLTPAPCLRRVRRLEEEGVITGYRAVLDPTAQGRGFEITVSVEITFTTRQTIEEFEQAILGYDEVVEARRVFGRPDYLLRVLVEDVAAYERWQTERLTRLPAVSRVVSHQTMKLLKTGG